MTDGKCQAGIDPLEVTPRGSQHPNRREHSRRSSLAKKRHVRFSLVRLLGGLKGELKGVRIDPSLLTPTDKEMLEDLIIAAFTDGKAKADRMAAEKMQALTAGLPLPPGMKLPPSETYKPVPYPKDAQRESAAEK